MRTRRREMLIGATAAVASAGSLPAPAIAQGLKELKMVTSWPENSLGLQTSAERLAQSITATSDGQYQDHRLSGRQTRPPFEVFDAVSAGVADMYHSDELYFESKSPALNFFGTVPYGLTADEIVLVDRLWRRAGIMGRGRRASSTSSR